MELKPEYRMQPQQREIFSSMPPEKKLQMALDLYQSARKLKAAGLRVQHPDWSDEQINHRLREIFFYART